MVTYLTYFLEDWNKSIANEDVYASNPTQEEMDANFFFFYQDLPVDPNEK